eukprot:865328-Pelagomonas_calceolata.AAC.1
MGHATIPSSSPQDSLKSLQILTRSSLAKPVHKLMFTHNLPNTYATRESYKRELQWGLTFSQ